VKMEGMSNLIHIFWGVESLLWKFLGFEHLTGFGSHMLIH
jgi:hypothetical protein